LPEEIRQPEGVGGRKLDGIHPALVSEELSGPALAAIIRTAMMFRCSGGMDQN